MFLFSYKIDFGDARVENKYTGMKFKTSLTKTSLLENLVASESNLKVFSSFFPTVLTMMLSEP